MLSEQTVQRASTCTASTILVFLHIPKTAGTTLSRIIDAQYNPLRVYSIFGGQRVRYIERFKRLPPRRLERIQVLKGHMGFGLHRYFSQPSTYLTMLREPVDQIASSYYYALSNRFHPLHAAVKSRGLTLEQFIDLAPWGNNLQTKLIGGLAMAQIRPPTALAAAKRGELAPVGELANQACTADLLAAAKQNLKRHFSVVGLTECFEESLALMILEYGWTVSSYQSFRRSGKRPRNIGLDGRTQARIRERNTCDLELYTFGRELFRRALEERRDEVARTLDRLRSASPRNDLRARGHAGIAWARFALSLARSAF